jgi:hypothetical protein
MRRLVIGFVALALLLGSGITLACGGRAGGDPRAALEAQFPDSVSGEPLAVEWRSGRAFVDGLPEGVTMLAEQLVAEQGLTLDDVTVAMASWTQGSILAMRLAGGDAMGFFGPLLADMFTGDPYARWTSIQVAGKDVMTIPFGSGTVYVRPQGEVVWGVSAEEPALTEIFTALPFWSSPSEHERVAGLDLEIQTPPRWQSSWDADDGRYWLWRDDEDTLPSLSIHRALLPDPFLVQLRELPVEQVLDALASIASTDARRAWNRDPETTEVAQIGGADSEVAVPARLLTYRPDFDDIGPGFAIDVVAFVDPWAYAIQLVTASGDELADRYVFERILKGVRFICSKDGVDDCPAAAE